MAETSLDGIKACAFDAYGTLFNVHAPVGKIAGRIGEDAGEVSKLWRQKQLEYTWLRSLMPAHVEFWQVTGEALDYALAAHGIDDGPLRNELMQAYLTLDAFDDANRALRELKAGGRLTAILSNGSPDMLDAAVVHSGMKDTLDEVISIEDVKIYKPSPKVYQLAVDRLAVQPHEICFVSTNGWDAAGAAHFGFQVVWLNRFDMVWENLPGTPKAIITNLDELPPLLG